MEIRLRIKKVKEFLKGVHFRRCRILLVLAGNVRKGIEGIPVTNHYLPQQLWKTYFKEAEFGEVNRHQQIPEEFLDAKCQAFPSAKRITRDWFSRVADQHATKYASHDFGKGRASPAQPLILRLDSLASESVFKPVG